MARFSTSYMDAREDEDDPHKTLETLLQGESSPEGTSPMEAPVVPSPEHSRDVLDELLTMPDEPHPMAAPEASHAGAQPASMAELDDYEDPRGPNGDSTSRFFDGAGKLAGGAVNDLGTIAALLLDAKLNKGAGVGQIAGAWTSGRANASNNAERRALQEQRIAAGGGTGARGMTPEQLELARRRAAVMEQNATTSAGRNVLSGKRLDETLSEHGRRDDINSDRRQTELAMKEQGAGAAVRGRENEKHEMLDQMVGDASELSKARAAASVEGRNTQLGETPTPITPAQQENIRQGEEGIALKKTADARALEKMGADEASSFTAKAGDMINIARAARHLDEMYSKGGDGAGIGAIDSARREHPWLDSGINAVTGALGKGTRDISADPDLAVLQSYLTHDISGAATGGADERERIKALSGTAGGMSENSSRAAIKELRRISESTLRSHAKGREQYARGALPPELQDIIPELDTQAQAAPQAAPLSVAAPKRGAMPSDQDMTDLQAGAPSLGDTGQSRNSRSLPKVDAVMGIDADSGVKPYTIRTPKGVTHKNRMLSPQELEKLRAKGFEVL